MRGRRPTDDGRHPGLGSSDHAALVLGGDDGTNRGYVLYTLPERREGMTVDVTLSLTGHDGAAPPIELPEWHRRPVDLKCFDANGGGSLRAAQPADTRFVLALDPETDLADAARDDDPFGFGHLFLQQLRVELRLIDGEHAVSTAETRLDVADVRLLGSLYGRVLERVVGPDVARQAAAAGVASPGDAYHPWFPVLLIGMDKASLYTRALVADIVHKQRYLAEPGWLLRVGVYLELLTCLGIADAVRADVGDLLTPAGTCGPRKRALRADPQPHRRRSLACGVGATRDRVPEAERRASRARLAAEPVAQEARDLEFLRVHHEDLKQAIELAGPNRFNAQETWQRVFRDAERAVLRQTSVAFPELGYLPRPARELVLWHRRARLDSMPNLRVPQVVAKLMLDQDGLFAAACNQYRASMNAVAAWADGAVADESDGERVHPAAGEPARGVHGPSGADPGPPAARRLRTAPRRGRAPGRRAAAAGGRRAPPGRAAAVPDARRRRVERTRAVGATAGTWAAGAVRDPGNSRARPSSSSPTARSRSSCAGTMGPTSRSPRWHAAR